MIFETIVNSQKVDMIIDIISIKRKVKHDVPLAIIKWNK